MAANSFPPSTNTAMTRVDGKIERLDLPDAGSWVIPGVTWGRVDELFTPAFWKYQAWLMGLEGTEPRNHSLGRTLREEVAACLLGGHGIPAEVGIAAFERLRDEGVLRKGTVDRSRIYSELSRPLSVGSRYVRYRFVEQRTRYLAEALSRLSAESPPSQSDRDFRRWLTTFRGIGLKTASWITRNWLNSDDVAIIDIHVYRGGLISGVFSPEQHPQRHYLTLESRFLAFARALPVRASVLDILMWRNLRLLNDLASELTRARRQ